MNKWYRVKGFRICYFVFFDFFDCISIGFVDVKYKWCSYCYCFIKNEC